MPRLLTELKFDQALCLICLNNDRIIRQLLDGIHKIHYQYGYPGADDVYAVLIISCMSKNPKTLEGLIRSPSVNLLRFSVLLMQTDSPCGTVRLPDGCIRSHPGIRR